MMATNDGWMRRAGRVGAVCCLTALLAACASAGTKGGGTAPLAAAPVVADPAPIVSGTMRPYQIRGQWYRPAEQPNYDEVGQASWYGDAFHGRPTATGERFDMHALSAAHKTLPLPGLVEVTNLANGRRAVLRLNDRGPFVSGRIIDLSRAAAEELGLLNRGVGEVRVRYLGQAPRLGGGAPLQQAAVAPQRSTPLSTARPYLSEPGVRPVIATTRAEAPRVASSATPSGVWIEVATLNDRGAAEGLAYSLGERARADAGISGGWRVMTGPWTDPIAAELARQDLVSRGYGGARTISTQ